MKQLLCLLSLVGLNSLLFSAEAMKVAKAGDDAPDVKAVDEEGKEVVISSFKSKNGVVIFFYPKADTPG